MRSPTTLPSARTPVVLRAGDPPDLVVHRRGVELAPDALPHDRRRTRSRVVVADMYAVTRHGMRALCEICGTVDVVAEASSVDELIALVVETGADLVVMGFEPTDQTVTRRLLERAPFARLLVLSPSNHQEGIARALNAGVSGYLSRSAGPDEFKAAMETLRAGGTYLDKAATAVVRSALERDDTSKRRKRAQLGDLTEREIEIARLMSEGLTARRVGTRLGISERTVNTHLGSLYRRLGVNNRVDAIRELIRRGITPTPR